MKILSQQTAAHGVDGIPHRNKTHPDNGGKNQSYIAPLYGHGIVAHEEVAAVAHPEESDMLLEQAQPHAQTDAHHGTEKGEQAPFGEERDRDGAGSRRLLAFRA